MYYTDKAYILTNELIATSFGKCMDWPPMLRCLGIRADPLSLSEERLSRVGHPGSYAA